VVVYYPTIQARRRLDTARKFQLADLIFRDGVTLVWMKPDVSTRNASGGPM
tara:strand:+ start:2263 stop:2415 length:153 start_codon:yes stop_codon:yes gene_type:complete